MGLLVFSVECGKVRLHVQYVTVFLFIFLYLGIIYLISALNHLEDSQVTFVVCARDQGGRTSSVNASVTVKILKTAIASAVFEKSRYMFVIAEDAPQGSTIGIVKAREPLSEYLYVLLLCKCISYVNRIIQVLCILAKQKSFWTQKCSFATEV